MCADLDSVAADNTANIINQQGGKAEALTLDVANEDAVKSAIQDTATAFGSLDVIFNNAGIGGGNDWHKTISVNLSGVYYGLHHGAVYMAENGGGAIINTSSLAGLVGVAGPPGVRPVAEIGPGPGAYVAAKHGVVGLTRQYAIMFGAHGVRVNAIAPVISKQR
tara:strand:+ start:421 stop:912 length:492 start_codon:yes stop_codon:yes gene_type:complete